MSQTPALTSRRRPGWSAALALAVGALLFWLAVRQVDWASVAEAVRRVSPLWLAAGAGALAVAHVFLAMRWRVLVNADARVSLTDAFDFLMIGLFAGIVLTPRLGDVARAVAAGRFHGLSASRLFGTIMIERLLDVIMLLTFGVLLAQLMAIPPPVRAGLFTLLGAAVAAMVVVWMGAAGPLGLGTRVLERLRGPQSRSIAMFARFVEGTSVVRVGGKLPAALTMAVLAWGTTAVTTTCYLLAFGLDVPWYAGAFVIMVINLGGLVPAPPAGLGVYHYLAALALAPWLDDPSTAFAFALVSHAVSFGTVLTLGTFSLARKGLSVGVLRRMAAEGNEAGAA